MGGKKVLGSSRGSKSVLKRRKERRKTLTTSGVKSKAGFIPIFWEPIFSMGAEAVGGRRKFGWCTVSIFAITLA